MKVLKKHPELAYSICRYIFSYKKIPAKLASEIIGYIRGPELYHSVNGMLLRACLGKLQPTETALLGRFCSDRLIKPVSGSIPAQPSYKEALIAWSLNTRTVSFAEYDNIVASESDWWVKKCAIRELSDSLYGAPTYADFINRNMRLPEAEVARIAASRLIEEGKKLTKPYGKVETTAKQMLKVSKVIRVVGQPASLINEILAYIVGRKKTAYDWKKFFGSNHRHAEHMIILLKRNRESNIDTFLVQLDSYCDFLNAEIYVRLKPGKKCPYFGSAMKDAKLIKNLPVTMACFASLHDLRLESITAHPKAKKTGKPTRRLKHTDFYKIKPDLIKAFDELEQVISP